MARCRNCGATVDAEELERHEVEGLLHVHCPRCGWTMGRYNRHQRTPPAKGS